MWEVIPKDMDATLKCVLGYTLYLKPMRLNKHGLKIAKRLWMFQHILAEVERVTTRWNQLAIFCSNSPVYGW